MPSPYALFVTFSQATHLPLALLWCLGRGLQTYPNWENLWIGLLFHVPAFMLPTIHWREQLTGGWYGSADTNPKNRQRTKRLVPFSEQFRNVFVMALFAEFMTTASWWTYKGEIPTTLFTVLSPDGVHRALLATMKTIDLYTPQLIYDLRIIRLGLFTTVGYFGLYGGLATMLGEGLESVKNFIRNWVASAARLDAARGAGDE